MKLLEAFLAEAVGMSREELISATGFPEQIIDTPLSFWPWKDDEERSKKYGEGAHIRIKEKVVSKATRGWTTAFLAVAPFQEFTKRTGRGQGDGWMVDLEIAFRTLSGDRGAFIVHSEKRFPDRETAAAWADKLAAFTDAHSYAQLAELPRSGPQAMSKPPV